MSEPSMSEPSMSRVDPIFARVTAPGSVFEIGERDGLRRFVNAPCDLNMLIEAARAHGDKTCIVEGERRYSFEDIFRLRDALVVLLEISAREHVAICMRNRSEWMIAFLAVIRAGGVAVLVNSRAAPVELAAAVHDTDAKLVLADEQGAALLAEGGYAERLINAENFLAQHEARPEALPPILPERLAASADDACAILFTSGTTGRVKGAVLTHENLITGVMSMQLSGLMVLYNMAKASGVAVETLRAQMPQQVVLQIFPLFHISGLGAGFLSPLFSGSRIVLLPRWDVAQAVRLIEEEKITQFTAVPTMLWDMVQATTSEALASETPASEAPASKSTTASKTTSKAPLLSSLRNIGTGGQALPINLLDAVHKLCPQAIMGTGYGMTECAGSVAMAVGEDFLRNRASAGRVLALVDMKIVGLNDEEMPTGEAGEILVRGAMVMKEYWKQPAATDKVLGADGWLRTGDIGCVDAQGYVFLIDRKKDMVISGGENIYCAEVERIMNEMPQIRECAALGLPDERLGEALVAVVVADTALETAPAPGTTPGTGTRDRARDRGPGVAPADEVLRAAIIATVGAKLARYKAPRKVFFASALPRNAVGKVDKAMLRASIPAGEKN